MILTLKRNTRFTDVSFIAVLKLIRRSNATSNFYGVHPLASSSCFALRTGAKSYMSAGVSSWRTVFNDWRLMSKLNFISRSLAVPSRVQASRLSSKMSRYIPDAISTRCPRRER